MQWNTSDFLTLYTYLLAQVCRVCEYTFGTMQYNTSDFLALYKNLLAQVCRVCEYMCKVCESVPCGTIHQIF